MQSKFPTKELLIVTALILLYGAMIYFVCIFYELVLGKASHSHPTLFWLFYTLFAFVLFIASRRFKNDPVLSYDYRYFWRFVAPIALIGCVFFY